MELKFAVFFFLIMNIGFVLAFHEEAVWGTEYTHEFYLALVIGGFGILVIAYFIISFFRSPRNKWDRKKRLKPKKVIPKSVSTEAPKMGFRR